MTAGGRLLGADPGRPRARAALQSKRTHVIECWLRPAQGALQESRVVQFPYPLPGAIQAKHPFLQGARGKEPASPPQPRSALATKTDAPHARAIPKRRPGPPKQVGGGHPRTLDRALEWPTPRQGSSKGLATRLSPRARRASQGPKRSPHRRARGCQTGRTPVSTACAERRLVAPPALP